MRVQPEVVVVYAFGFIVSLIVEQNRANDTVHGVDAGSQPALEGIEWLTHSNSAWRNTSHWYSGVAGTGFPTLHPRLYSLAHFRQSAPFVFFI
jgi:hypothetical protein